MPERDRCRWTDISLLLEGDARKRYDKLDCAERAAFETRFWALLGPCFSFRPTICVPSTWRA
jgi:hypothetical protein